MSFENKVILITGGSSGIGAATAIKFSQKSAKIVIVGRNETKLQKISNICEQNGCKPLVIIADVTKKEESERIISETVQHYGKLDVLVNNVGILKLVSILDPNAIEEFDHIMATNFRSAVQLTHLAAPHLIKTKGNIVNISSTGSTGIFYPGNFSYCSSKAALDHFTRSIALELAPKGVRVNCVNPGPVKTDCMEHANLEPDALERFWDDAKKSTALGRISDSEEIADVILFLASDTAKSITGSCYLIDNGMLLK